MRLSLKVSRISSANYGVRRLITKYGYDVFFTIAVMCLAVIAGSYFFIEQPFLRHLIIAVALVLFLFALNFFRDPDRKIPKGNNLVLSPADGTIVAIKNVLESDFLKSDAVQISIFMSPINVHVNRIPVGGTVAYFRYVQGKYFAAFEEKASLDNEQTHIGIDAGTFKVFFKQIAGFLARRIVCTAKVGDPVTAGARFGMIKFGSRVDVFVPKNSDIKVAMNEQTIAGETVLAVVPEQKVA
ncbi:MAG: phosphatidylserine decarboxylase family protein [Bacteroidota bacterium]|nr:phosphatidylserine decarboxylase family protein [Bacteroidota bacterium]